MIGELKPYPEYKDSGDKWLGLVPLQWRTTSLGAISLRRSHRNRPDLPLLSVLREKGVVLRSSLTEGENRNFIPDDLSNYRVAQAGDLVVNKMKAWQGSVGIAPTAGIVSPAYFIFELSGITKDYAHRLLRSRLYADYFARSSDGVRIGQWDLSIDQMKRIPAVIPSLDEQDAIVRYLHDLDKKVNSFIRNRRKLIEVLSEQKQAIINRAVTRGLDPNAPLKPSGIDWLGDVPKHWAVQKLKFVKMPVANSFVDGPFGSNLKSEHYVIGGDVYVVESGFITSGQYIQKEFKTITANHFESIKRSECLGGDIIIAKIGAHYGMAGVLPKLDKPAVVSGNSLKLTVNNKTCNNHLIHMALLTARALGALETIVNTTAQPALTLGSLNNLPLPIPPLAEQTVILKYIGKSTFPIIKGIASAQREIDLIREYRTRLIADVVTGKVDVRHLAPMEQLPSDEDAIDDELIEAIDDEEMPGEDEQELIEEDNDADN